jgi:hypothetical protein
MMVSFLVDYRPHEWLSGGNEIKIHRPDLDIGFEFRYQSLCTTCDHPLAYAWTSRSLLLQIAVCKVQVP